MARDNVKFTYSGTTVYVGTISCKENYTNGIKAISVPTTESVPETTKLINLNKVEDRFTITGYLCNGKLGTETHTTAIDKKNALKTMFGKGNVITMTWEGTDYDCGVDKYEIDYILNDSKDNEQDGEAVYNVTITLIVGSDII